MHGKTFVSPMGQKMLALSNEGDSARVTIAPHGIHGSKGWQAVAWIDGHARTVSGAGTFRQAVNATRSFFLIRKHNNVH